MQKPDAVAWIKVIDHHGELLDDGAQVKFTAPFGVSVTVRYSVANDSHLPFEGRLLAGLMRDGEELQADGQSVVSSGTVSVALGEVWTEEYVVQENSESRSFRA